MGQLNKHKEGLQRERDKLLGEVTVLNEKLAEIQQNQEILQNKLVEVTDKATDAQKQMEVSNYFLLSSKPCYVVLDGKT